MAFSFIASFLVSCFIASRLDPSFARPAYEILPQSHEGYEVDETVAMDNSTLLHILHPSASDVLYGNNETARRSKRCCCCDCCCCGCGSGSGSGSGSGEEGVAVGDMIALASLLQANQGALASPSAAVLQPSQLPYPLVPRSVNWDMAPKSSDQEDSGDDSKRFQIRSATGSATPDETGASDAGDRSKVQPGRECVEDSDCVNGASCIAQYSWSGDLERRCVCRPPFTHVGDNCVAPDV